MAEKNSHETWSVTDSSRERADRSRGKPPVAKADSGLGGDTEPLDRDCLCQDDTQTMKDPLSHLSKQAIELIQRAHEQGRREAREEMAQLLAQRYKETDQLIMQLGTIKQGIQNLQLAMSEQFPGTGCGREGTRKTPMPCNITLEIPRPFERQASMNRQSSVESCLIIAKEETAGRRMARESSGTQPSSPTSCGSDDLFCAATASQDTPVQKEKHSTADEWRVEPQPNAIPKSGQGRYLSSSSEERKCKSNGLELHPRKMLASRK